MENLEILTLQETQKIALETLKVIDKICKDQNITYYVVYGTLLGAVRHGGFIPWDDDVDIAMPRKDFEKFVNYCSNCGNSIGPYLLQYKNTVKGYPFNLARFCDMRYYLMYEEYTNYASGIFVDIYPLDALGMKDNEDYWMSFEKKIKAKRVSAYLASHKIKCTSTVLYKRLLKLPYTIYCRIRGAKYFLDKWEQAARVFDWETSEVVGIPTCYSEKVYAYNIKHFNDHEELEFENVKVPVPYMYKELLREWYGDYMKLPPENQRKPYHGYVAYKK